MARGFEFTSDLMKIQFRDHPLADPTLIQRDHPQGLAMGEMMTLTNEGRLVRATDISVADDVSTAAVAFPLWSESGRTDIQAMGSKKATVPELGPYEFNTHVFDAAAAIGGGAPISNVLQGVKVATVTVGGRNYSGLVGHGGAGDTAPVFGRVWKLPARNGGRLQVRVIG